MALSRVLHELHEDFVKVHEVFTNFTAYNTICVCVLYVNICTQVCIHWYLTPMFLFLLFYITLSLGTQPKSVPVADLQSISYLAVQIKRWKVEGPLILPQMQELGDNLELLLEFIEHSTGRCTDLPASFFHTFQLVRLADYISCDDFLNKVAQQLSKAQSDIPSSSSNPQNR